MWSICGLVWSICGQFVVYVVSSAIRVVNMWLICDLCGQSVVNRIKDLAGSCGHLWSMWSICGQFVVYVVNLWSICGLCGQFVVNLWSMWSAE